MTQQEIENQLRQMEVGLIRLDAVTEHTANNLDRLTDIVSRLAQNQTKTDETVAILAKAMVTLTDTLNRFIRGQRNGDQPH